MLCDQKQAGRREENDRRRGYLYCNSSFYSTSSNSLRLLYEVALENGAEAVFVDSAKDLDAEILSGHTVIGFEWSIGRGR